MEIVVAVVAVVVMAYFMYRKMTKVDAPSSGTGGVKPSEGGVEQEK